MAYVEILRLCRALTWYAGIIGVLLLVMFLASFGQFELDGATVSNHDHFRLPWGILIGIAGYCAVIFASVIGPSLNKENDGVEMVWTKPVMRERLAASYVLADLAGIVVAGLIALAACLLVIEYAALRVEHRLFFGFSLDGKAWLVALLAIGIAFMWYGLLQLATCWYSGRAGMVVGLSWGVFMVLSSLSHLPPGTSHSVVMFLNIFNPLAYLSNLNSAIQFSGGEPASVFPMELGLRVAIVWAIALVSASLAILTWKRLEAN